MLFIITLAIVKKPYLVDGGLMVKKNEDKMTPRKRSDKTDKGGKTISIATFLIACHTNDRVKRFMQRNIRVNAR